MDMCTNVYSNSAFSDLNTIKFLSKKKTQNLKQFENTDIDHMLQNTQKKKKCFYFGFIIITTFLFLNFHNLCAFPTFVVNGVGMKALKLLFLF